MKEQALTKPPIYPRIVYDEDSSKEILVDPYAATQTMRELGISEQMIARSTLFIDSKNRLANYGTHYPNVIGRLRFFSKPELRDSEGDIIRISTTVRGKHRTAEKMNRTAVHEWEHLAQADRKDRKLTEGHIAIYGLALAGALAGNKLGRSKSMKSFGTILGIAAGHTLGYMIAPHERQARSRAKQVRSHAVTRKTT